MPVVAPAGTCVKHWVRLSKGGTCDQCREEVHARIEPVIRRKSEAGRYQLLPQPTEPCPGCNGKGYEPGKGTHAECNGRGVLTAAK
jgi:hypothetical protein